MLDTAKSREELESDWWLWKAWVLDQFSFNRDVVLQRHIEGVKASIQMAHNWANPEDIKEILDGIDEIHHITVWGKRISVIPWTNIQVTRVLEAREEEPSNEDILNHWQLKYFLFYGPPPEKVDWLQKYDLKDRKIVFPNGQAIDLEMSVIGASDIVEIKSNWKTLVTELFACTRVEGSVPEYAYLTQPIQATSNRESGVYHRVFTLQSEDVIRKLIEWWAPLSLRPNWKIDSFWILQQFILESIAPHSHYSFPIPMTEFPYFAPKDITYPESIWVTAVKAFWYIDSKWRNKVVTYSLHGYKWWQDAWNEYYRGKMSKEDTLVVTMTVFDLEKLESYRDSENKKAA